MPETPRSDRIKPCLLERLTDENPDVKEESRSQRVVTPERYLRSVARDILWLFGTRAHPPTMAIPDDPVQRARSRRLPMSASGPASEPRERVLSDFPEVAQSVVGYGIPDLTGLQSANMSLGQLCKELEEVVRRFEPRVMPKTLSIRPILLKNGQPARPEGGLACCPATSIGFEVRADVWMDPIPEHLHLRTIIDLDTGTCEMTPASHEPTAP